ncbi:hypothetical protein [Pyxidicoccus sp. MSG2]|uniref:hypothetical protein n=1 Tax=Pyxidicoccus sp. MSG2 TaxID=2996790 RepID=UPI0022706721|nr:hypothetical protein [Pyxidicoccus sp. MSG2]MCY1022129.1 hypothetical protein [Pyxidicoccus sp. MSG2]
MTALATSSDPLVRKALISGGVAMGMFVLGWVWVFVAVSTDLGDAGTFRPLAILATIQLIAGFRGFIQIVKARRQGALALGPAVVWALASLCFGLLGLMGVPLFLLLQSGMKVAFKG